MKDSELKLKDISDIDSELNRLLNSGKISVEAKDYILKLAVSSIISSRFEEIVNTMVNNRLRKQTDRMWEYFLTSMKKQISEVTNEK